MPLNINVQDLESVDEKYRDLYTEQTGGGFALTDIVGMKTQQDIDKLNQAKINEVMAHKETKKKLEAFGELKPDEVQQKLARIEELEILAKGASAEDLEEKANALAEARTKAALGPVQLENTKLNKELEELREKVTAYAEAETHRLISDDVTAAMTDAKILDSARPDILLMASHIFERSEDNATVTKENAFGVPAGVSPEVFFTTIKEKKPHWWPASVGGNAGGGSGGGFADNPWSAKGWNMTKQGAVITSKGKEVADQMARAAGTTVGGPRPAAK